MKNDKMNVKDEGWEIHKEKEKEGKQSEKQGDTTR